MTEPQTSTRTSIPRAADELRRAFLGFFEARGHTIVPSSPLVPNDPTLLFTTAGMVQFKPYYAAEDVPYTRAASVQKCLRLTDLDNVGSTPRHVTFFEMLGNFSFGPKEKGAYFKEEAVAFAWEFVTKVLELPKARLYASIFAGGDGLPRDDEAEALWHKAGVAADHIVALGRADNFWGPAGGQGACGPCSEIYFDLGEQRPAYLADGAFWGERPGDPGDRYMEFWNLVFPQFDAKPDGTLTKLARPGIDTGMGLERLAMILQGKSMVFETDLLAPTVEAVLRHRSGRGQPSAIEIRDARIVADHMRALTFAIAEGALPGNEGAGYVLRRLLRRAVARLRSRQGMNTHDPVLAGLARGIAERFGGHYKELASHAERIAHVVAQEEEGFATTYDAGFARLEFLLSGGAKSLGGDDAFQLHDTYGFPIELTAEIASARGVAVDGEGFERAMDEQRQRARAASKFAKEGGATSAAWTDISSGPDSEFVGYGSLEVGDAKLRRWRSADDGEIEVILDRTPAYAESGGQVADRGTVEGGGARATLAHVHKEGESIVHRLRLVRGDATALIAAGAKGLRVTVDAAHRRPTMRHHTATHLLHAGLRRALGEHVRQAGSLVAPDRLRFDYTHFEAPSREQLAGIEAGVNEWVLRNRPVHWEILALGQAKAAGAMALFGEKYGARVRMVTVDGVPDQNIPPSLELCGGTHVERTGDIGAFVIVSDGAVASGVRRIEALCGREALDWLEAQRATLHRAAAVLQSSEHAVPEHAEKLKAEVERLRKELAELKRGGLADELAALAKSATAAPGGRWVVAELASEATPDAARDGADALRGQLGRGAAVLAFRAGEKLTLLAAVSDDLVAEKKLRADELVRAVAKIAGGSGGGKPHLALAGAKDPAKLPEALEEARRLLGAALAS